MKNRKHRLKLTKEKTEQERLADQLIAEIVKEDIERHLEQMKKGKKDSGVTSCLKKRRNQ